MLELAREKRAALGSNYVAFADLLLNAQQGPLAEQRGHTADDIRRSIVRDEHYARKVAALNRVKADAYRTAYDSMQSLRSDLTAIAAEGNNEIKQVANSKLPTEAKTVQISSVVQRCKSLSNIAAAKYAGNVLDAMQRILDQEATGQSARQLAHENGVDLGRMFQAQDERKELELQVRSHLEHPHSPMGITPDFSANPDQPSAPHAGEALASPTTPLGVSAGFSAPNDPPSPTHRVQTGSPSLSSPMGVAAGFSNAAPQPGPRSSTISTPPKVSPPVAPSFSSGSTSPMSVMSAHEPSSVHITAVNAGINPAELAQSFNKGFESGAPFSAAAHAAPPISVTSTEPQISHAAQTIPSAAPNPQVHVPVVDSPQPVHHVTAVETPATTPIVAAAQPISPPVTPQAVGPLPTYGSDLRPPVATTITPTPPQSTPLPPSATPSSAPVTPSSGHSAANQPALVRQTASSTPPPTPPTQGTQAVAATATGAAIGTASADATARKRLQRLVNTVARQQPRLAWAAGDRADNTTLLVTDLASGWIPPGIDLPSAVTLLPPARRRGKVEVLLGDVTVTASYTPTHHLADDGEQTSTSLRPRSVPDVSDLGWELSQATQWRDGLPRLAHTLAKAASAGTGVLDSEIDLLHEHLAETSKRVLDDYPNHIDTHDVGNWQLLAALDALVVGDNATANYHLAWFLAAKAG
ncbi:DUF5632 domain-containing protein [Mycobacterium paragordonae]|uniref:DUF5632 domain-containing protein n=1 Tax=Mycobacterium paragordonae TaxID=1389713 RepID=UPI0012E10D70|nr:DUF5631 domain-containing protein [Mycobacterium paragordonae]